MGFGGFFQPYAWKMACQIVGYRLEKTSETHQTSKEKEPSPGGSSWVILKEDHPGNMPIGSWFGGHQAH